jgi:uncharacterized protein (TIGR02271 family)
MNNDRDMMNQSGRNMPVTPGTNVYDATGDKIGTVEEYNPQADCIVVQKGIIFTKDLYIPLSAIDSRDSDGLYLNLTKDQLKDDRYANPPTYSETTGASAAATTTTTDDDILNRGARRDTTTDRTMDVPVREEELTVDKQRRQVGEARIHKDTVEEQQSLNVPVNEERVTVERVPVDKDLPDEQANAADWQNRDVTVPVMGEDVTVEKRPRVKEEVRIHKEPVTETEHVADTVRKERVRVEGVDEHGNPVNPNDPNTGRNRDRDTNS